MEMFFTSTDENCKATNKVYLNNHEDEGVLNCNNITDLADEILPKSVFKNESEYSNYISQYVAFFYIKVLRDITIDAFLQDKPWKFVLIGDGEPGEFSLKYIFAAWLELFYDKNVPEVIMKENGKWQELRRDKNIYSITKEILAHCIKQDLKMNGYKTIAAAHIHNLYHGKQVINEKFGMGFDSKRLADTIDNFPKKTM